MNKKNIFITGALFVLVSLGTIIAYAHSGHGDEEAANLGTTATAVTVGFLSPEKINSSDVPTSSYPGIITSDAYGSVFSSREGIVTGLSVNLGDKVSKGQVIGTVSIVSNTPEIIALIAGKKSEIAIAEGRKEAAVRVKAYMEEQMKSPDTTFQTAYDQKRNAVELSFKIQGEKLLAQIESAKAQIEAKKKIIAANTKSAIAVTASSDQKVVVAQESLQNAVDRSFAALSRIFYDSNTMNTRNISGYSKVLQLSANSNLVSSFQSSLVQFANAYIANNTTPEGLILRATAAEDALKKGLEALKYTITSSEYSNEQLEIDKKELIDLIGGEDGISVSLAKLRQIQKESISSGAESDVVLSQSDADIVSFQQEIILLQKELKQLDTEKEKDLATISGDQSVQSLDLYTISLDSKKIINESNRDLIIAEAEVKAAKNALSQVTGISSQSAIYAPFAGTISRKNVSIGQSIQTSTPLYDIVGNTKSSSPFIRSDIPVADLYKISIGKSIMIHLPGGTEKYTATIKRIASSVKKEDQTIAFEAVLSSDSPYPLGTQVRILPDATAESFYKIPLSSYFEEGKDTFVWKVMPDKKLKKWKVKLEKVSGENYAFVNEGITETSVIIQDVKSQTWTEGQTVSSPNP